MAAEGGMWVARVGNGRAPPGTGEVSMTDGDKLALSTRMYVRLRHCTGRITDAMWMAQNADYAREILKLARRGGDDELLRLADRFEEVVLGVKPKPAPAPSPAYVNGVEHEASPLPIPGKYTGSLR
ncbi:MAG TPA: hypothetical protein VLI06_13900 [Solimonas sp.]|nr:hypothetical protein [Solimonas sp.]